MIFGIINEGKVPADSRVPFTPAQCKNLQDNYESLKFIVQSSTHRCYTNAEYKRVGIEVSDDISSADIIFGIKEIPEQFLIPGKTYFFFSHTKKLQPYNRAMCRTLVNQKCTLIDYECLEYNDGTRVLGFGFFAGVVGAHNGIMAYGKRAGTFKLGRVNAAKTFNQLIKTYFGLRLPNVKVAVTGSGRVAHGIIEIMSLLGIQEVEKSDFLKREFQYPVYVQLKTTDLYIRKDGSEYNREDFHNNAEKYSSVFGEFLSQTDILMNGIYWDSSMAQLFSSEDIKSPTFRIQTIADITDDLHGSVPINLGDASIAEPVYGVDKHSLQKTLPYLPGSVDVMAVGNLPNELPRDASHYFGEQLSRHIVPAILENVNNDMLERATIINRGQLTEPYSYMQEYVGMR